MARGGGVTRRAGIKSTDPQYLASPLKFVHQGVAKKSTNAGTADLLPPLMVENHVLIQHLAMQQWSTLCIIIKGGSNHDNVVKTGAGRLFR